MAGEKHVEQCVLLEASLSLILFENATELFIFKIIISTYYYTK